MIDLNVRSLRVKRCDAHSCSTWRPVSALAGTITRMGGGQPHHELARRSGVASRRRSPVPWRVWRRPLRPPAPGAGAATQKTRHPPTLRSVAGALTVELKKTNVELKESKRGLKESKLGLKESVIGLKRAEVELKKAEMELKRGREGAEKGPDGAENRPRRSSQRPRLSSKRSTLTILGA